MLALLLACAAPEPAPAPAPAPVEAPAAAHAAAPHQHSAPHGGVVQTVGDKHVEALMMPDGIMFWLTDAKEAAIPVTGYTGTAVVKGPDGVTTVDVRPMGDHLHAAVKLAQGQPATAVLTLQKDGAAESASFETKSVGMEAHAHTSLHGGEVLMRGDHHVEYAPSADAYRVWLTDAVRAGLTENVEMSVKDGEKVIPLVLDPATKMFSAPAEGAGTRPVTLDVRHGDTRFSVELAPRGGAAGHGHAGGEPPGHTHR